MNPFPKNTAKLDE